MTSKTSLPTPHIKAKANNGGNEHVLNMATKAPQLTSEQLGLLRSTPPHATIPT
ncbi:MAG: hypothetical protein LBC59_00425 [Chitinispirillales bacterium]|nr:hypothetical protein [Chitinispirillales bacterium]